MLGGTKRLAAYVPIPNLYVDAEVDGNMPWCVFLPFSLVRGTEELTCPWSKSLSRSLTLFSVGLFCSCLIICTPHW